MDGCFLFFFEDCWKQRARFQQKRTAVKVNAQLLFSLFFWWQFKGTKLNYNCALGPRLDLFWLKLQKLKFDQLWHRKNAHISHKHSQWILCITALEWHFGSFKGDTTCFPIGAGSMSTSGSYRSPTEGTSGSVSLSEFFTGLQGTRSISYHNAPQRGHSHLQGAWLPWQTYNQWPLK